MCKDPLLPSNTSPPYHDENPVSEADLRHALPSRSIVLVLGVVQQRRLGDGPLVRREEESVGAGRVHLVRLAGVDGFLLHVLDVQRVQLLIEDLQYMERVGDTSYCATSETLYSAVSRLSLQGVYEWKSSVKNNSEAIRAFESI